MSKQLSAAPHALDLARKVLSIEADAVQALVSRIDDSFLNCGEHHPFLRRPGHRQRHG